VLLVTAVLVMIILFTVRLLTAQSAAPRPRRRGRDHLASPRAVTVRKRLCLNAG